MCLETLAGRPEEPNVPYHTLTCCGQRLCATGDCAMRTRGRCPLCQRRELCTDGTAGWAAELQAVEGRLAAFLAGHRAGSSRLPRLWETLGESDAALDCFVLASRSTS